MRGGGRGCSRSPEQEQLLRVRRQVPKRPRAARRRVCVRDRAVEVEPVRRRQRLGPRQPRRHVQLDLRQEKGGRMGGGWGGGRVPAAGGDEWLTGAVLLARVDLETQAESSTGPAAYGPRHIGALFPGLKGEGKGGGGFKNENGSGQTLAPRGNHCLEWEGGALRWGNAG
jgi:hypothetical protein